MRRVKKPGQDTWSTSTITEGAIDVEKPAEGTPVVSEEGPIALLDRLWGLIAGWISHVTAMINEGFPRRAQNTNWERLVNHEDHLSPRGGIPSGIQPDTDEGPETNLIEGDTVVLREAQGSELQTLPAVIPSGDPGWESEPHFGDRSHFPTLAIVALARDEQQEQWSKVVDFVDKDLVPHRTLIPLPWCHCPSGAGKIISRLASGGFALSGDDRLGLLVQAIQTVEPSRRARILKKGGWHKNAFILKDLVFGDKSELLIFCPNGKFLPRMQQKGTLSQWQQHVAYYCTGNDLLLLAVSMAFAAVMQEPLEVENGGFNCHGKSSTGKTTTQYVAASVMGSPSYMKTLLSTTNGLEGVAAEHNNLLMVLNEFGQLEPKVAGAIAYMLGNGSGKMRANSQGTAKESFCWNNLFLCSAEVTLGEHMAVAGHVVKAGQEVRVADISADAGAGMGMFQHIHGFPSPSDFGSELQRRSAEYYGTAIVAFLEELTANLDGHLNRARQLMAKFSNENVPKDSQGFVHRVGKRFALVAAAGEIATEMGITGWPEGEAFRAATGCFKSWLVGKADVGEADDVTAHVVAFLQTNQHRLHDLRDKINPAPGCIGFRNIGSKGEATFFITPAAFHEELCNGLDRDITCHGLLRANILKRGHGSHMQKIQRVPAYGGKVKRFYTLHFEKWPINS